MKMPSRRKKLPVWTVRWVATYRRWHLSGERGPGWSFGCPYDTKKEAIRGIRVEWERFTDRESLGIYGAVSLRIYGKDGRIQEERTYPRSADPRRSKG